MAFLKNVLVRSETFAKALRARAYAPCPRTGWESAAPPASRQAPPASRQAPPVRRGRLAVGFSQQFRQDQGGLHQYFPPIASVHTSRCLNWLLSVLAWRRLPPASAISRANTRAGDSRFLSSDSLAISCYTFFWTFPGRVYSQCTKYHGIQLKKQYGNERSSLS